MQVSREQLLNLENEGKLVLNGQKNEIYDAVDAMNELKAWEWMSTFVPDSKTGFTFSEDERVLELCNLIDKNGIHSGSSLGITVRIMQNLSKILVKKN